MRGGTILAVTIHLLFSIFQYLLLGYKPVSLRAKLLHSDRSGERPISRRQSWGDPRCLPRNDRYLLKFNAFPYFHQTDKQRPLCYLYFVLKGHYADFVWAGWRQKNTNWALVELSLLELIPISWKTGLDCYGKMSRKIAKAKERKPSFFCIHVYWRLENPGLRW